MNHQYLSINFFLKMKSKKKFKKKNTNYRRDQDEIRIKERRKQPKKLNKHKLYTMIEDDELDFLPHDKEEDNGDED